VHPLPELFDAFGAGVYLLFGAIHLDLWLRRRERRGHLWLACAAACALAVDLTGLVLRRGGGEVASWIAATNLAAVAGATICLFELVAWLGARPAHRRARLLEAAALVLALVSGLWVPRLTGVALLACGAILVWAMVRAFRAALAGDPDSGAVAGALVFLTACLLADVAMELKWLPARAGLPIVGFTVLFLASARSLNDRADREHKELEGLRQELERRVEERTLALTEASERLAEASRTDELTGLPNRRGFLEASEGALARARRSRLPLSLAIADIDHFKRVNDTWGHAAGDAVLREVAATIRASLRAQDLVARWGGEEFILLLPDTPAAGAVHVAGSIRVAVAARGVEHGGIEIRVRVSFGVAEHRQGDDLDSTLARADAALYRAKQEGRDRVVGAGLDPAQLPSAPAGA
jgi:diguanylate cyclase (GGDEF)-like protein